MNAERDPQRAFVWIRWAVLGAVVVGLVLAYTLLPLKDWLLAVADGLKDLGPVAGIAAYLAVYTVACLVFLPAAVLAIAAGATWDLAGFPVAVVAATLAASAAFVIARWCFHGRFRAWILGRPRLHAVETAVNQKGATLVFLLRLSPIMPFPLLNYLFGLTHLAYRRFVVATFFGMMPITFMWVYVGSVGGEAARTGAAIGTPQIIAGVVGVLITLSVTIWVGKAARRALREAAA